MMRLMAKIKKISFYWCKNKLKFYFSHLLYHQFERLETKLKYDENDKDKICSLSNILNEAFKKPYTICGSEKFRIRPKLYRGPWRGCRVPRTNDRRPRCQGERLRTTLSSALQDFNGKINVLVKAIPKQPLEGDVSGIGPTWRYGAK